MGTDISGIAKNLFQLRTGMKTDSSDQEAAKDIAVSFMEMMNRGNLSGGNISLGQSKAEVRTDVKGMANTSYDPYTAPAKTVSVKESVTPEELNEKAAAPLEEYEAEVRKVLKEELGVTDEEITEAMENLGMSFLDLRNIQDLTALVQELTGEDVGMLFLSESFVNVVKEVSSLTEALCSELGITKEELAALGEAWEQMEEVQTPDTAVLDDAQPKAEGADVSLNKEGTKAGEMTAADALPKEGTEVIAQEEETAAVKGNLSDTEEAKTPEQTVQNIVKETDTGKEEKGFMDSSNDKGADVESSGTVFVNQGTQTTVQTEEFILPQEVSQPAAPQTDAYNLIEQIAKNVRVTISATTTSMEMLLNPENLGKIYLNVSEREGVVRAQIATQNQVVKEALEAQLVELRQSLNQQGVKVDAIEVTVGTHEFEQNLEENAQQEEQMRRQMEETRKQTRRSINLNDLDSLAGLMSEEERLAAQIMRDNGNQVDLTA